MDETDSNSPSLTPLFMLVTKIQNSDVAQEAYSVLKRKGIPTLEAIATLSITELKSSMSSEAYEAISPYLAKTEPQNVPPQPQNENIPLVTSQTQQIGTENQVTQVTKPLEVKAEESTISKDPILKESYSAQNAREESGPKANPVKVQEQREDHLYVSGLIRRMSNYRYAAEISNFAKNKNIQTVQHLSKIAPHFMLNNGVSQPAMQELGMILRGTYKLNWEGDRAGSPPIISKDKSSKPPTNLRQLMALTAKDPEAPPESIFERMPLNYGVLYGKRTKS